MGAFFFRFVVERFSAVFNTRQTALKRSTTNLKTALKRSTTNLKNALKRSTTNLKNALKRSTTNHCQA